jgi:hypothetical protein
MATLLPPQVLHALPSAQAAILTGKHFFPQLIEAPFQHGLAIVFVAAALMAVIASLASWLRGGRYVHDEAEAQRQAAAGARAR